MFEGLFCWRYGARTSDRQLKNSLKQIPSRVNEFYSSRCTIHKIKLWNVSAASGIRVQNCMSETAKTFYGCLAFLF